MRVKERHRNILKLLEERDSVELQEIVELYGVSEATVRRDFSFLEESNLLYRTHGGAIKRGSFSRGNERSLDVKIRENIEEKKKVARYIADNIIQRDQTIYLDAGTSTYEIIDYMKDRRITVVTNSAYHLDRLIQNKIHTIILGGTLKHSTKAIVGHTAVSQLNGYSFDLCFIGCNGIDEDFGITTAEESEAFLKSNAIRNSKKKFILADIKKFGRRKFQKFADIKDATIISYEVPEQYNNFENIIKVKE